MERSEKKKYITVILVLVLTLSFAACSSEQSDSKIVVSIPSDELNTLNKVFANGYEDSGRMINDNVYAQEVTDSKDGRYILIVRVPAEMMEEFETIDFLADDAGQKYLALIGDVEFTEARNMADFIPSQDEIDAYKGITIAEFEITGAEMTGYCWRSGYRCDGLMNRYHYYGITSDYHCSNTLATAVNGKPPSAVATLYHDAPDL